LAEQGTDVPDWLPVLLAAEDWHTPPWVIEEDATEEWWGRWRCLREERAEAEKK
jgi:hypothetical protein